MPPALPPAFTPQAIGQPQGGNAFMPPPPLQPIDNGGYPIGSGNGSDPVFQTNPNAPFGGSNIGNNLGNDAPFGAIPTDTPQTPTVVGPFGQPSSGGGGATSFVSGSGQATLTDPGINWSQYSAGQTNPMTSMIASKFGKGAPGGPPTDESLGGSLPGYARGINRVPAFRPFPQQNLVAGLQKPVRLGMLHPYARGASNVPGTFIGRDSVPAMLEPGEAVVNRGAMARPGMRAKVAYLNRIGRH